MKFYLILKQMIIHPIWTWLWNISFFFFIARADIKNPIYSFIEKKKTIELSTNKTYQEKLGFLALFRIEQGFPCQIKLKSTKGKQVETIGAYSGQAERRRRKQLGGTGASPDAKIFYQFADTKVQCVSTGNILPEFFFQPTIRAWNFFGTMVLCRNLFLTHMHFAGYCFSKSPPPPPPLPRKKSRMVGHLGTLLRLDNFWVTVLLKF